MIRFTRIACFFLPTLFCGSAIFAQQNTPPAEHPPDRIFLDVVVTAKSGPPLAGLRKEDFTLLDNNTPQTIASFRAVPADDPGQSVILVMDGVNMRRHEFLYARTEVEKFLHADGGHLAYPTALATLTTKGIQLDEGFRTDGNALATALDRARVDLLGFELALSSRYSSHEDEVLECLQISTQGLDQVAADVAPLRRRKLVIWLSPGWPVRPAKVLNSKRQQQISGRPGSISDDLLKAHVILYCVYPLRTFDTPYGDFGYEQFLKDMTKPNHPQEWNLLLQVLAVQSGGLALPPGDIADMIRECLRASAPYYEISFDPPAPKQAGEYHRLEIKLAKAGLMARTLQGYYAQP